MIIIGDITGDIRSLDYGSCKSCSVEIYLRTCVRSFRSMCIPGSYQATSGPSPWKHCDSFPK